MTYNEIR